MDHVEACERCATFWEELQAAQQIALSAPVERLSSGFQEGLWDRIKAGEGTPDAVFLEPIPTMTKVRYLGMGAAAAALLVMLSSVFSAEHSARQPAPDAGPVADGGVAGDVLDRDTNRPSSETRRAPRLAMAAFADEDQPLQPFQPDRLAMAAASNVSSVHRKLDGLAQNSGAFDAETMFHEVETLQEMGSLLLNLQDGAFITLEPRAQKQLAQVVYQLDPTRLRLRKSARDALDLELAPILAQTRDLRDLPRQLFTRNDRERFFRQLRTDRQLVDALGSTFIVLPADGGDGVVSLDNAMQLLGDRNRGVEWIFINTLQLDGQALRRIGLIQRFPGNQPQVRAFQTATGFAVQVELDNSTIEIPAPTVPPEIGRPRD